MSHKVFISYNANTDRKIAENLCEAIEASGIKCWMAPRDVRPGKDYKVAISKAIRKSEKVVYILSKESAQSKHVRAELGTAFSHNVDIIPFQLEEMEIPPEIEHMVVGTHCIEAFTEGFDVAVKNLVDSLIKGAEDEEEEERREEKKEEEKEKEVTPLPVPQKRQRPVQLSARLQKILLGAALLVLLIAVATLGYLWNSALSQLDQLEKSVAQNESDQLEKTIINRANRVKTALERPEQQSDQSNPRYLACRHPQPEPNPTLSTIIGNDDRRFRLTACGSIRDMRTGLEWTPDLGTDAKLDEAIILIDVKLNNELQLCGHNNWRLPKLRELQELSSSVTSPVSCIGYKCNWWYNDQANRCVYSNSLYIPAIFHLGGFAVWMDQSQLMESQRPPMMKLTVPVDEEFERPDRTAPMYYDFQNRMWGSPFKSGVRVIAVRDLIATVRREPSSPIGPVSLQSSIK